MTKFFAITVDVIDEGEIGRPMSVRTYVHSIAASYAWACHIADKLEEYCDGVAIEPRGGAVAPERPTEAVEIPF